MNGPQDFNYILFSDVHLGADLVQHVRPGASERHRNPTATDRDLAAMLDWYREHRDPQRPWCLVIAGDLVDFIGMSIAPLPDHPVETALNDEERMHGLGSAPDHAATKMRAVAARHGLVFDGLARFVAEGHHLVLVRGNHDMDFHWEDAREAFVRAVVQRIPAAMDEPLLRRQVEARIRFCPWFYYVEGLLYVEHGHQFDAVCNYPHLLAPLQAADPSRLHWSLSDWLLRAVARPTPGLGTDGHDKRGIADYIRFAWSLGVLGGLRLGHRYLRALVMALRTCRHVLGSSARALREEHERGMARVAHAMRVGLEPVRALAALWPRPVASGWLGILRNAFLDRLGAGAAVCLTLPALWLLGLPLGWVLAVGAGLLLLTGGLWIWSARQRVRDVDAASALRLAAKRIAELFPARFVVMGHTHKPVFERLTEAATYVNLGNWAVDDLDGPAQDAPRTHLVLQWVNGQPRAEFRRWDSARGPTRFG